MRNVSCFCVSSCRLFRAFCEPCVVTEMFAHREGQELYTIFWKKVLPFTCPRSLHYSSLIVMVIIVMMVIVVRIVMMMLVMHLCADHLYHGRYYAQVANHPYQSI